MNPQEILKIIADNPSLCGALRELLEKQFEMGELKVDDSDILLGQLVRARLVGLKCINTAFKEIEKYKTMPDSKESVNPAR